MKIIHIIISLMLVFSSANMSFADDIVKAYGFEKDTTITGVVGSSEKFFNVSDNWKVKGAKLNLVFTKSELLDVDYSTITVFVNDTPIHSEKLQGAKQYKKEVSIDIPQDIIKPGYNSLVIKSYKTISDKICRDDSNTANWLVIHKETNINIKYDYNDKKDVVSEYPNIFTDIGNADALNTVILVPDKYSSKEIAAAMNMSADLGKKLKNNKFTLDVKFSSEFNDIKKNIIYIGNSTNTSPQFLNLLTNEEKENIKTKGIIKIAKSPFNQRNKVLLIMSDEENLLEKATKLLSSDSLIKDLNNQSIFVDNSTDVNDLNNIKKSNNITLKELGYEDILVKGPFSQEVNFDISIPKSKLVNLGSKLNLNFRYAKNLDFERSLATVYINNVPVGSKKLSVEKADNDNISITLPEDVLEENYYQIKVVFNLELLDLQCVTRDTDNPWACILNNSFIDFAYAENNNLTLKNYPYPFIKDGTINDLQIVIPNVVSSKTLTDIANISSYIGRDLVYNNKQISVSSDKEFIDTDKNKNLFIIGTPLDNEILKNVNNDLYIKFNEDFTGFKSNDKSKFIGEYASQIASIQLINSPYNQKNSALVISSTDISDIGLATKYLSNLNLAETLKGDGIIIDRNNKIEDNTYKETVSVKKEIKEEDKFKLNKNMQKFILIVGFLFITLIISIILLVIKYKKTR